MGGRSLAGACGIALLLAASLASADDTFVDPYAGTRQSAELPLFYITMIGWGSTATVFIDGLTQSSNPYAIFPALAALLVPATGALGGALAIGIDRVYGRRPGVAQIITTSMLVSLGEGIALNEYFSNRAYTSFHTLTHDADWVFGAPSVGLGVGLVLAALVHTTPGRAAWVETTGIFAGVFAGSIAGAAFQGSGGTFGREGNRDVGLASAVGGVVGVGLGVATSRWLSPSLLRSHLVELGWMGGALVGGLACLGRCSPQGAFAAVAVGSGVGFGGVMLATAWLGRELRGTKLPENLVPVAVPLDHGISFGVAGVL